MNIASYKAEGNSCHDDRNCGRGEYCKQIRWGIDRCAKITGSKVGDHCSNDSECAANEVCVKEGFKRLWNGGLCQSKA